MTKRFLMLLLAGLLPSACEGDEVPSSGRDAGVSPTLDTGTPSADTGVSPTLDTGTPSADTGVSPTMDSGTMTVADTGTSADVPTQSPQCLAAEDVNAMTPQPDGIYHFFSNNSSATREGGLSAPMGCLAASGATLVHQKLYRYRMRATARFVVRTDLSGTDAALDTALVVAESCSPTAPALACNDNVGAPNAPPPALHSFAYTRDAVPAGTVLYFSVGSASPTSGTGSRNQGNFEIALGEAPISPLGGTCTGYLWCPAGADCVAGICRARGTEGGQCLEGARCEAGGVCVGASATASGICYRPVAAGGDCTAITTTCAAGSICRPNPTTFGQMLCVANGTQGGDCRPTTPSCDNGLTCFWERCRTTPTVGMPCDPMNFRTACSTMGTTCVGGTPVTSGTCSPPVTEVEPNNDSTAPSPAPVTRSTVFTGSFSDEYDWDCFRFTIPANTSVVAEVHQNNGVCGARVDTVLALRRADGSLVTADEDSAMGLCSRIDGTLPRTSEGPNPAYRLPAGTYAICAAWTQDATRPVGWFNDYFLSLQLIPPS